MLTPTEEVEWKLDGARAQERNNLHPGRARRRVHEALEASNKVSGEKAEVVLLCFLGTCGAQTTERTPSALALSHTHSFTLHTLTHIHTHSHTH